MAVWMVLAEEEYFNMLSFVLVPTHGSINSMHTYVCIDRPLGVCKKERGKEEGRERGEGR